MKKYLQWRVIAVILSTVLFVSTKQAVSQNIPVTIPPSPNAASLGTYGQIPVSYFSGLANISIPIGTVTANDVNIDISLNYHGGGIKPDQHAGWVGLGWDLNAGGVITRRVNGGVDEILATGFNPETLFGYYYNYARADSSNWYSTPTLAYYVNAFQLSAAYPAPDEFMFNFGKYSGSFFYNHKGQWQVRSSDPICLKVEEEIKDNFQLDKQQYGRNSITIRRIFYRFTLTTPDGCKYIFGGTPQSVEFTRDASVDPASDPYNNNVIPTSWYLTKIITNKQQEINFTYERDGINVTVSSQLLRYYYKEGSFDGVDESAMGNKTANIINPSYLSTISTPNQTVKFSRSVSRELPYGDSDWYYEGLLDASSTYEDLSRNESVFDLGKDDKWFKLDSISFYSDTSSFLRKVSFAYYQNDSSRLRLDSMWETGAKGQRKPPHVFAYDTTRLPRYNSRQLDHWGFYNGRDYITENPKLNTLLYTKTDVPAYAASKNSDLTLMKAGILTAIKYPTGGKTTFVYEPHAFSKVARRYPLTAADTNGNVQCGGLRIKKVINDDAFGNTVDSKEYFYVRDYNGGDTSSSGILGNAPVYLDEGSFVFPNGTLTYWFWYDYSIEPLSNPDGNHVTYSEVAERSADGSYTIYRYSNHDQSSYTDTLPLNGLYTAPNQWKLDPTTSKALERGKLLSKADYRADGVLLHKTVYDYDTSAAMHQEAVRIINLKERTFGNAHDNRATAYLIYTFPRFLLKETDSLWDQNGSNPVVTTVRSAYNQQYRLATSNEKVNSAGDTMKVTYRHPYDMLTGDDSAIYRKMIDSNNITPIIEQKDFTGATQLKYIKNNYYSPYSGLFVPQSVDVQTRNNPVETRLRFSGYDNKGNILTVAKDQDYNISYIWGYEQTLPVAEVKNAAYSDIAYTSFESDSTGNWNNYAGVITTSDTITTMPPTGKRYYTLTTTNTLTRNGLTSSKTYILSYWTTNNAAFTITGTVSGYPLKGKTINGWTYYEHKFTGQTSITLSGSGDIDEVRLYPFGALMTTYTYEPVLGMTSSCDAASQITYYGYDAFGRLALVRDQDRNVVKKICYNYAGQLEDCYLPYFYSVEKTGKSLKSNCIAGTTPDSVTYTVPAGKYVSTIGQTNADSLAQADVDSNKQAYADSTGICSPIEVPVVLKNVGAGGQQNYYVTFTGVGNPINHNFSFRNKSLSTGESYTGSVYWGTYDIEIEVKFGDSLTFSINGVVKSGSVVTFTNVSITDTLRIYAGTYWNTSQTVPYTRNNCPSGYTPSTYIYTVAPNIYTSVISQADANLGAIAATSVIGQDDANTHGTCTPPTPDSTTIVYTNTLNHSVTLKLTNNSTGTLYTFTLPNTHSIKTAGKVPTGIYHVTMHANGPSEHYSINSYAEDTPDTDFDMTNIILDTATTTVTAN